MKSFTNRPIIVPWDYSEMSKDALDKALSIADSIDQIEVIHVSSRPSTMEPSVVWGTITEADMRENLEKNFREKLIAPEYNGLKFKACFGDPGSSICEFASNKNAGLIVLSSHGRTSLERLFIGSVAERVVRLSPCPVLVLRGDSLPAD